MKKNQMKQKKSYLSKLHLQLSNPIFANRLDHRHWTESKEEEEKKTKMNFNGIGPSQVT